MAYNTKSIVKDVNQKPIPQYYNKDLDVYEVLEGKNGASKTILYDENGNPIDLTALISSIVNILNEKNLPVNASTESKQDDIIGKLASLLEKYPVALEDGKLSVKASDLETILNGILTTTIVESLPAGINNIGKVDIENSSLPLGASTEVKQDNIITIIELIKDSIINQVVEELKKPVKLDGSTMEYYGNSTDEKPTENIITGSTYFEIDTVEVYMWDGTSWVVI